MTFYVLQSEVVLLDCFRLGEAEAEELKNLLLLLFAYKYIFLLLLEGSFGWRRMK